MNFWKQIPNATKIYLVIFIYLVFLLCGLVILRQSKELPDGFSIRNIFSRFNRDKLATMTSEALAAQPSQTFASETAWLRARTNVQIFEGPGRGYPSVAWLEGDQTSEILGKTDDEQWWAIRLPYFSEGQGWVSAEQVEVHNVSSVNVLTSSGIASPASTQANPANAKAIANINIRSGPDLRFRKIGTLDLDQSAEIVGVSTDRFWWLIKVPDTENLQGWISKDYAVAQNADDVPVMDGQSSAQTTLTSGSPFLVANATVNVRNGPDVTFEVIGTLNQGQVAEIVGKTSDGIWWAISYPGVENNRGWVAAAYVNAENSGSVPVVP